MPHGTRSLWLVAKKESYATNSSYHHWHIRIRLRGVAHVPAAGGQEEVRQPVCGVQWVCVVGEEMCGVICCVFSIDFCETTKFEMLYKYNIG